MAPTKKQTEKQMENLKPTMIRSGNEAREKGKKGGIASGKKRRLMKNTRECFNAIKNSPLPEEMNAQVNEFFGTEDVAYTFAILNLFNILKAGCDGNANAMKQITEIDGSMDKTKTEEKPAPSVYIVSDIEVAKRFAQAEREGMPQLKPLLEEDEDEDDDE